METYMQNSFLVCTAEAADGHRRRRRQPILGDERCGGARHLPSAPLRRAPVLPDLRLPLRLVGCRNPQLQNPSRAAAISTLAARPSSSSASTGNADSSLSSVTRDARLHFGMGFML